MLRSCERPSATWGPTCAALRLWPQEADDADLRQWLQSHFQPMRVSSHDGKLEGLLTGYYEPLLVARRQAGGEFRVPVHAPPADLASRRPWWSRQEIHTLAAPQAALRGREIAYLRHPLDLLVLQIQGSGRLSVTEPDGSTRLVRVAFAGHNDQPYQSVGKWLIERGELRPSEASWPGIRAWALARPQRVQEMMWVNPRYVFFREEPLPDPELGPKGAQGVALSPGRSIAVDPLSIPYGTPVWLSSTDPLGGPPIQRAVMAQDTGSAIVGAVRADYFAGWGELAETQAGRMKQPLRLWVLWPRQTSEGGVSSAAP
jgi:membrane-bound lytic murein transglycosylase A